MAIDRARIDEIRSRYADLAPVMDERVTDKNHYEKAIRVSDEEMADIHISPHRFHGDWNYTIRQSPS